MEVEIADWCFSKFFIHSGTSPAGLSGIGCEPVEDGVGMELSWSSKLAPDTGAAPPPPGVGMESRADDETLAAGLPPLPGVGIESRADGDILAAGLPPLPGVGIESSKSLDTEPSDTPAPGDGIASN